MNTIGISQSTHKAIISTLRQVFHLPGFRPLQQEIISYVFMGYSQLAILPTGAGKSLCYQLPSVLLPAPTVVISPLLSLMQEQAQRMRDLGIRAMTWSHWDAPKERREVLNSWRSGKLQLVFLAPERLTHLELLREVSTLPCSLLVVDEAHSISEWGHDFRPDYRRIGRFRRIIGNPPVLALTATATSVVEEDIMRHLDLDAHNWRVTRQSMDRPNIFLGVHVANTIEEKHLAVHKAINQESGAVIVYTWTRRQAEYWGQWLSRSFRERVGIYHAGLSQRERMAVHQDFTKGSLRLVAATTAFGMGIDRSDVRGVLNIGMPPSLDAYTQQWGRAGRDGHKAWARLIVTPGDIIQRHRMLLREKPRIQAVEDVMSMLKDCPIGKPWRWDFNAGGKNDISEHEPIGEVLLMSLEEMEVVELLAKAGHKALITVKKPIRPWMISAIGDRIRRRYLHRLNQFESMKTHIETQRCRHEGISAYFGQSSSSGPDPKECCDICLQGITNQDEGQKDEISDGWQKLSAWRQHRAEQDHVNPYIIFSDKVLRLLAVRAPKTLDELRQCPGIGSVKLSRYGEDLVALLQRHQTSEMVQSAKTPKEQSWDLFSEGVPLVQVAARINRKPSTVIGYLEEWILLDSTRAWQWYGDSMVHPQIREKIRTVLNQNPEMSLKSLFAALEGQYTYAELRIARAMIKKLRRSSDMGGQPDPDAHTSSRGE